MFKQFIMACLLALCVACAGPSEQNYQQKVSAWVGKTPAELVTAWGEPTQVIPRGPIQYYVYLWHKAIPLPGTQDWDVVAPIDYVSPLTDTSVYAMDLVCQTTFVVKNDHIVDWLFDGNACKSY